MPLPPGPRLPSPFQLVGFFSRPTAFMERCQQRWGDVFTPRMPGSEPMVFLADPDLVKAVWKRDKVNGLPAGRRITLQPFERRPDTVVPRNGTPAVLVARY